MGKRRAKNFARKVDAERFLMSVETDVLRGTWVDPTLGRITLAEWSERWLPTKSERAPKTVAGYRSLL